MTSVSYSSVPGSVENQEFDEEIQNFLHFESFLLGSNLSSSDSGLDEGDVFQCGKCKKQFTKFSTFITHKKGRCQAQPVKEEETAEPQINNTYSFPGVKAESTSYAANRPVLFSESDGIISFTVQPESLNVPSTTQPLRIFTGNDDNQYMENSLAISGLKTLHIVEAENSSQTSSISGSYLFSTGGKVEEPHIILDENTNETVTLSLLEEESPLESEQITKHTIKELEYKMKCSFCGKLFRKKFDLQQHLRSHTKERPFQCIVCGRAFTQKSNVMKHMTTHKVWPTKLLTLPKNPIQKASDSSNSGDKIADGDTIMLIGNSFVCQYCPSTFSSFRELKSHRKTHSSQKVYKCIQRDCTATFEDLDSFLEHIQSHTNEAQYKCHMCHSEFSSLHDLAVHQNYHDTNNKSSTKTLTCRKCKGKFSSSESLEQHLATDSHRYPCMICQKVFMCERFLRRHLVTHSSATNFLCSVCHKSFRTEQYLNIHKTTHSSLKPFSCKLCSAKFNRKDKLSRHNLIHENAKRYKCPFNKKLGCGKEFNRKDKLKEHILTHDSSKNMCRVCNDSGNKKNEILKEQSSCVSAEKICNLHSKLSDKQTRESCGSESIPSEKTKPKVRRSINPNDDVPTIEIVVMPMLGSSDQPGEATFGVMFPSDGPVDLSQPIGALPYQEVPIYTIKPLK